VNGNRWGDEPLLPKKGKKSEDRQQDDLPERLTYGTHTLPKEFWVSIQRGANCLNDFAYKDRRHAKSERHRKNAAARAEENKRRGSR